MKSINDWTETYAEIKEGSNHKIGDFIKSLLEDHNTTEVVLASPLGPDYPLDEYEESFEMEEIDPEIQASEVELWEIPEWIFEYDDSVLDLTKDTRKPDDDFPRDSVDSSKIVRLGIVNGKVMYTMQSSSYDEVTDDMEFEPESDWLPIEAMTNPEFWNGIVKALIKVEDIWAFTQKFPRLRRNKE